MTKYLKKQLIIETLLMQIHLRLLVKEINFFYLAQIYICKELAIC